MAVRTIAWEGELPGHVVLIEQTKLPLEHVDVAVRSVEEMADAIARLAVRGAPAIGVAAAYGVVLGAQAASSLRGEEALVRILSDCDRLAASRPTAVNLFWALDRMRARARSARLTGADGSALASALLAEARAIHREDAEQCERMGAIGADLIQDGMTVLTHCNAGALATGGIGTALAPIYTAAKQGKRVKVFADETRPLLQGARLTAWELAEAGIDVTLITDSMAGRVMFEGKIDLVFVGSDRIARNGDVCNKIGTYTVAVLARRHAVPFYVVAPLSTFDPTVPNGAAIPIEERPAREVTEGLGRRTAPEGVSVYNPAFDVTPAELVSGIVTEVGLIEAPDRGKVEDALRRGGRSL